MCYAAYLYEPFPNFCAKLASLTAVIAYVCCSVASNINWFFGPARKDPPYFIQIDGTAKNTTKMKYLRDNGFGFIDEKTKECSHAAVRDGMFVLLNGLSLIPTDLTEAHPEPAFWTERHHLQAKLPGEMGTRQKDRGRNWRGVSQLEQAVGIGPPLCGLGVRTLESGSADALKAKSHLEGLVGAGREKVEGLRLR
ncbi:unnamed protein product [Anisakis simplex]|uniref:Uncharacterized protein n=1 Tax=Anisakis simplex TaxID=6269 RepID=A0A3P6NXS3_ANISI|nr:unnamed protein product [Anisakis simplex]